MRYTVFERAEGDGGQGADTSGDDVAHRQPAEPIDGVQRDTDFYLERADEWRDAEIDRQMGRE